MKSRICRIIIIVLTVVVVSSIFLFCFKNSTKIIITDCNTKRVVTEFYTKDYETEAIYMTIALNDAEDIDTNIKFDQQYEVHIVDPKNSFYDYWYFIYVADGNLYVQNETDKIKNKTIPLDDNIKKCTMINLDELNQVLAIG